MTPIKLASRNLIRLVDDFEDETPTRDDITREWQPSRELIDGCRPAFDGPTLDLPTPVYLELAAQAEREGKSVSQVLDEEVNRVLDAARMEWS